MRKSIFVKHNVDEIYEKTLEVIDSDGDVEIIECIVGSSYNKQKKKGKKKLVEEVDVGSGTETIREEVKKVNHALAVNEEVREITVEVEKEKQAG